MSDQISILNRIKLNLGISHDKLDNEIEKRIASGRKDLMRLGVTESKANSDDELVSDGLIAFVCMWLASDPGERDGWEKSWQIISVALKDSSEYYEESEYVQRNN